MNRKQKLALALALLTLPAQATAQWSLEHLSFPKTVGGVTTVNGYLLAAGGLHGTSPTKRVDVYDAQTRTWSLEYLSTRRWDLAATAWGDRAYFAGGENVFGQRSDVIDVFDSSTQSWSTLSLPTRRKGLGAGAANGILMFACGYDGPDVSASVDIYDTVNGTWSSATIAEARTRCTVVAVGDELLVAGGFDYSSVTAPQTVSIYNTLTQTWRTDVLPGGSVQAVAAVVGNKAYFASDVLNGGPSGQVYDGATQAWSGFHVPHRRGGLGLVAHGSRVLFGGGNDPVQSDIVDILDTQTGTWTVEYLPIPVLFPMTGSVYGRALFVGGITGGFSSSNVLVYEPAVGSVACGPAVVNSTGSSASIRALGSMRAGGDPLALVAERMPANQFCQFLAGRNLAPSPISGSNGILCLGAPFGLFANDLTQTSAAGVTSISVDTEALPLASGMAALAGETWYFQAWFREPAGSSNLSDAVGVTFN